MDKDSKTIDIKLPRGWEDLTQKQLRYLFTLIAQGYSVEEVKTFCLFRWNKITILHRYADNGYMCKKGKERFVLTALQVAQAIAADDWLITPAIIMAPNTEYEFSFDTKATGDTERFEVKIGDEPTAEAMTKTIIAATEIEGYDTARQAGRFSVPADGKYYVGIHVISDANKFVLNIDNISIVEAEPSAISNINVEKSQDNNYYDLMGRKYTQGNLPAGIYIHAGKKVVIK